MTRTSILAVAIIALLFLGAAVLDANRFIRQQDDRPKKYEIPIILIVIPAVCIIASIFIR